MEATMKHSTTIRLFTPRFVGFVAIVVASIAVAFAGTTGVTIPHTFTTGTTISSGAMNGNFTAVAMQMPGVKAIAVSAAPITITTSYTSLASLTITAPTTGNVVVRFDGETSLGALGDYLYLAASDASNNQTSTVGAMGQSSTYVDAPSTGNNIYRSFSHTIVIPVTTVGSHTYYALANGTADTDRIWGTLTVEFFPNGL